MLITAPYLNIDEIDFYYDQLYPNGTFIDKSKRTIELSLTGAKYSETFEQEKDSLSSLNKLDKILDVLFTTEMISTSRPNSIINYDTVMFGYEQTSATKLFFPKSKINEIHGLNHLVVWVSDPDHSALSKELFDYRGTFLYLIETVYDRGVYRTTLSGCSALQVISNMINGQDMFKLNRINGEPLGRGSFEHPIDKLKSIGAIEIGSREIQTIYRKRYITDEQCFRYNNETYRCNDLLAYPLFIDANR